MSCLLTDKLFILYQRFHGRQTYVARKFIVIDSPSKFTLSDLATLPLKLVQRIESYFSEMQDCSSRHHEIRSMLAHISCKAALSDFVFVKATQLSHLMGIDLMVQQLKRRFEI